MKLIKRGKIDKALMEVSCGKCETCGCVVEFCRGEATELIKMPVGISAANFVPHLPCPHIEKGVKCNGLICSDADLDDYEKCCQEMEEKEAKWEKERQDDFTNLVEEIEKNEKNKSLWSSFWGAFKNG